MDIEIGLVETAGDLAAVFALRMLVFVEEQRVPVDEELDIDDVTATHFLVRACKSAFDEPGLIVATARLVDKGNGIGKIGRVAVVPGYRRKGLGAGLMQFIERYARVHHFRCLVLEAQCYAIPFYEKLGYIAEGAIFLDANIEHRNMSMALIPDPTPAEAAAVRVCGCPDVRKEA
jgi:predicted GNAT family N-acyltransferase